MVSHFLFGKHYRPLYKMQVPQMLLCLFVALQAVAAAQPTVDAPLRLHSPLLDFSVVAVHSLLFVVAVAVCLVGFFHFKLLLTGECLLAFHFFLQLLFARTGLFDVALPSHHWGLLFSALFLAANAVLATNVFVRLNYGLLGFSLAGVCVFLLLRPLSLAYEPFSSTLLALLALAFTAALSFLALRSLKMAVPFYSAAIGACFGLRSLNILTQRGDQNTWPITDTWFVDASFVGAWVLATAAGFWFQLRMKDISDRRVREGDLEEINRRSYLA